MGATGQPRGRSGLDLAAPCSSSVAQIFSEASARTASLCACGAANDVASFTDRPISKIFRCMQWGAVYNWPRREVDLISAEDELIAR